VLGENGLTNGRTTGRCLTITRSVTRLWQFSSPWPKPTFRLSHPPYSPDLAPSDFWLFPKLKMGLRGRRFAAVEDIKENADARLHAIKEDFHQCYSNWIDRCNRCVCVQMENTSKAIKFVNHGFHIIKTYSHIPRTF
jgi:hypothetical protein